MPGHTAIQLRGRQFWTLLHASDDLTTLGLCLRNISRGRDKDRGGGDAEEGEGEVRHEET